MLWGHAYYLVHEGYDDIPHGPIGADGEGGWPATSDPRYGGGMSFTLGTWNRAGRPYASSTYDIARASPLEQIRRSYVIVVRQDGGDWREWPNTSRECGLR